MQKHIWRPFTQEATASEPIVIKSAKGCILNTADGKQLVDLTSSWWTNIHGHCNEQIATAISKQAARLDHVLFADFSHDAALSFTEELRSVLDQRFEKFFFSDNGSTSVEVAIKMAYQYWQNKGTPKTHFVSLNGGYHGDTVGAMSVGRSSGFFNNFSSLTFKVFDIPFPETWIDINLELLEKQENFSLNTLKVFIEENKNNLAAILFEPLIQGASGMRMCRPEFLNKIMQIARENDILVIFDEVMTGFYRTGKMFAYEYLNDIPDIICLSKGITGGFLPLGLTACQMHIYDAFYSKNTSDAFLHGHSYTANPIVCAAAAESIKLCKAIETRNQINMIQNVYESYIETLRNIEKIEKIRTIGTILAFDLKVQAEYGSDLSKQLKAKFLEKNLAMRPLGNTVYIMPPYCISKEMLSESIEMIVDVILYGRY